MCGKIFNQQAPIVLGVCDDGSWMVGDRGVEGFNSTDKTSRLRIKAVPVYHF